MKKTFLEWLRFTEYQRGKIDTGAWYSMPDLHTFPPDKPLYIVKQFTDRAEWVVQYPHTVLAPPKDHNPPPPSE